MPEKGLCYMQQHITMDKNDFSYLGIVYPPGLACLDFTIRTSTQSICFQLNLFPESCQNLCLGVPILHSLDIIVASTSSTKILAYVLPPIRVHLFVRGFPALISCTTNCKKSSSLCSFHLAVSYPRCNALQLDYYAIYDLHCKFERL